MSGLTVKFFLIIIMKFGKRNRISTLAVKTCFSCGTTFQTNFVTVTKCNVCLQTDAIKKYQRNTEYVPTSSREEESWRLINRHFERGRILRENAEQQRIQQEINEASISNADAFDHGQNFINNPKLKITLGEDLLIRYEWEWPYVSDRLRSSFKLGLDTRIKAEQKYDQEVAWNNLKQQAYQAGIEHVSKKLPLTFTMNPNVLLNNIPIKTKRYTSNLSFEIDETDGTLTAHWSNVFDKLELNELYKKGIEEGLLKLNTPEQKQRRLLEKQEEARQQQTIKRYRLVSDIFKSLVYIIPAIMLGILWSATTGWWTVLSIIFCFYSWTKLKKEFQIWCDANKKYL